MPDFFFNNPIGQMQGPLFLGLYFGWIVFVSLSFIMIQALINAFSEDTENTVFMEKNPDPYLLAYMHTQDAGVLSTAMVSLLSQGFLIQDDKEQVLLNPDKKPSHTLPEIEQALLKVFDRSPERPKDNYFLKYPEVKEIRRFWANRYRVQLETEGLLKTTEEYWMGRIGLQLAMAFLVLGPGVYKLWVAIQTGHENIWILVYMILAFGVLSLFLTQLVSKRTAKGEAWFKAHQALYQTAEAEMRAQTDSSLLPLMAAVGGAVLFAGLPLWAIAGNQQPLKPFSDYQADGTSGCSSSSSSSSDSGGDSGCGGSGCGVCGGGD